MELRDYLRIARRRWLLIVGTVIATVGLAALVTSQTTPQYASTARVFISTTPSNSGDAYQGGLFSEQRVTSYADVISGLELSQKVIDELGLDLKASDLAEKIEASVVPETVVLKITVTDPSPKQAKRINDAVVDQLKTVVSDLETPPGRKVPLLKATVVDSPRLPETPVSPQPLRNIGLGLVLGLLLGFGLAVLREVLDTSVKRVEDVGALGEAPVLSSLAYDPDVQAHPLITTLPSHAPRAEAFRVLRTNVSFIDVDRPSKTLVVTSSVPGEGKSTTAINAALAMATAGQRVLLVDGDLRRPQVAELLNLEPTVGLTTVLVGKADARGHRAEARTLGPVRAHRWPAPTQPGRAAAVQGDARGARRRTGELRRHHHRRAAAASGHRRRGDGLPDRRRGAGDPPQQDDEGPGDRCGRAARRRRLRAPRGRVQHGAHEAVRRLRRRIRLRVRLRHGPSRAPARRVSPRPPARRRRATPSGAAEPGGSSLRSAQSAASMVAPRPTIIAPPVAPRVSRRCGLRANQSRALPAISAQIESEEMARTPKTTP